MSRSANSSDILLTKREITMFRALGVDPDRLLKGHGSVVTLYEQTALKCFREKTTGPYVDSLRECLAKFGVVDRHTAEWDDLIWGEFRTFTADWCAYDQLSEQTLEDGELIEILWPNGTINKHTVRVVKASSESSDHGHPVTIPESRASIVKVENGLEYEMPLRPIFDRLKGRRV